MIERLAVDSNAVIEWLRSGSAELAPLRTARSIALPLPVVGELYTGAYASRQHEENRVNVEAFVAQHEILLPDMETARIYGELRARLRLQQSRASKMNDVWIAALAIQHDLPLLTNDRGFAVFPSLRTLHW